jgi:hypothetical protein
VHSTDAELIEFVARRVDERIAHYADIRYSDPERADTVRFTDSIIFGAADETREHQIARGLEYYKTERERQRGIVARIAQHKIIDIGSDPSEI